MTTLIARASVNATAEVLLSLLELPVGIEMSPALERGRWASVVPVEMTNSQSIALIGGTLAQVHLAPGEEAPAALVQAVHTFNADTRAGWLHALDEGFAAQLSTYDEAVTRLTDLRRAVTSS